MNAKVLEIAVRAGIVGKRKNARYLYVERNGIFIVADWIHETDMKRVKKTPFVD